MTLFSVLLASGIASAAPLESGEFYNTAHVLGQGQKAIHPLYPSIFGLPNDTNFKTTFLGWLGGPNAISEIAFVSNDSMAISADISFTSSWDFKTTSSVGGQINYTSGGVLTNRLNASAGLVRYGILDSSFFSVPVSVGYDVVKSESTTIQFIGTTDINAIIAGVAGGTVGAAWNKGWESYRLRLGLMAAYLTLDAATQDVLEQADIDVPDFFPLPDIQMWWLF